MTGPGSGSGTGGSPYDSGPGGPYQESYPGVPYGGEDFNGDAECPTSSLDIESYQDVQQVRNCRLLGLRDLRLGFDYPRNMVRDYMNDLIGVGVAGFRIDAAKHMWPGDMEAIFAGLNNLNSQWFPAGTRPYIFQEVIDQGGEPITAGEYTHMGRVTEFKYSIELAPCVRGENGQRLAYLANFGEGWGFLNGMSALVFTDNHDNQRDHGGAGDPLTYKDSYHYKIGNAFELAWNYGHVRIMSSYDFNDGDQGPPGGGVNCFDGNWICEHAWRQIYNMVKFHNAALGEPVSNWEDNGNMRIAFSRGSSGFIAINKESGDWSYTFQTGLPAGEYCDVISCDNNRPPCGDCRAPINVDGGGMATITVPDDADPVIAIHV